MHDDNIRYRLGIFVLAPAFAFVILILALETFATGGGGVASHPTPTDIEREVSPDGAIEEVVPVEADRTTVVVEPGLDGASEPEVVATNASARGSMREVRVEVVDAAGRAVPGCRVRIWRIDERRELEPGPLVVGEADADGRFEAELSDSGAQGVHVQAVSEIAGVGDTMSMLPSSGGIELRVELVPGALVQGRLLDADGRPLPGTASALLHRLDEAGASIGVQRALAMCGRDGRFELVAEAPLGRYELWIERNGWGATARVGLILTAGASHDVGDLRLERGLELEGRVLLPNGEPLAAKSVQVQLRRIDPEDQSVDSRVASTRVDSSGRFRFRGLGPDPYQVRVRAVDGPVALRDDDPAFAGGPPIDVVALVRWLEVTPRREDGTTTRLEMLTWSLESDPGSGRSAYLGSAHDEPPIDVLPPVGGGVFLNGHDANGVRYSALVDADQPAGRHTLDLSTAPPGFGSLRLRFEGAPLPEQGWLSLNIHKLERGYTSSAGFDVDASTSEILWSSVPPGRYELRPFIVSRDLESPTTVRLPEGPTEFGLRAGETTDLTLRTEAWGRIAVRITVADPAPDELFQVQLHDVESNDWERVRLYWTEDVEGTTQRGGGSWTEAGRRVWIDDLLPPGALRLRVVGSSTHPFEATATVRAGETVLVEAALERRD